jgi:hypothetical protein
MKPMLQLREGDMEVWKYGNNSIDGALRLVSVEGILNPKLARIDLTEWTNSHIWPERGDSSGIGIPRYAALSHVWESSEEVMSICAAADRPLSVDTGKSKPHVISWLGLTQAATAAKELQCGYLWLDFLCLNQRSPQDKALQIQNMAKVYSNAGAVIVMVGGVGAAQSISSTSSWINRAWTLQEATLCDETYVLVRATPGSITSDTGHIFLKILDGDIAIARLSEVVQQGNVHTMKEKDLIAGHQVPVACLGAVPEAIAVLATAMRLYDEGSDSSPSTFPIESSSEDSDAEIPTLPGSMDENISENRGFTPEFDPQDGSEEEEEDDWQTGGPPNRRISDEYWTDTSSSDRESQPKIKSPGQLEDDDMSTEERSSPNIQNAAAWRSMYLRTSTKPQDMIFSMMHLLRAPIQVDYERTVDELLFELVAKSAMEPAWLTVGYDIPVHPRSGLISLLPCFISNSMPTYDIDTKTYPASEFIASDFWCRKYDIIIKSTSPVDGHLICALILDVQAAVPSQRTTTLGEPVLATADLKGLQLSSPPAYTLETHFTSFKGRLGSILLVIGEPKTFSDGMWGWSANGEPFVYSLDKNDQGIWLKTGAGMLAEPIFLERNDPVYRKGQLKEIARRHLRVGGCKPDGEIKPCDCEEFIQDKA